MLDTITQTSHSGYARAVPAPPEAALRAEQPQTISQKPQAEVKRTEAEHIHEQKQAARREEKRDQASYRANSETASYSPKYAQSQASQLADKLLEGLRQSRQEKSRDERQHALDAASNRQSQLERTYHPSKPEQPRYIDEIA